MRGAITHDAATRRIALVSRIRVCIAFNYCDLCFGLFVASENVGLFISVVMWRRDDER